MNAQSKPLINLLRGWPNPRLLPVELMRLGTERLTADLSIADPAMLYGPDEGDAKLRTAVAEWLAAFYEPAQVSPDRICISGGASQSLGCVLQTFTEPEYTRNIWLVCPTYFLAFRIFQDAGFHYKLRAVPEDDEGIDISFLRNELIKSEEKAKQDGNNTPVHKTARPWSKIFRHIIYTVPTFSNPSSKTMTMDRRVELVRLAREFDALVVTDDVYDFLQWPSDLQSSIAPSTKAVMPRLVDVDHTLDGGAEREGADGFGNVVSNGTFSKIAGPGLRTGWVEGSAKMAYGCSQTGTSRSGGAPSHFTAAALAEVLATGELQSYVYKTLQPAYASRYRKIMSAIEKYLIPLGVELPQKSRDVVGGYFVWMTLPAPLDAVVVSQQAKSTENLIVAEGEMFQVPGDETDALFPRSLRLCFSWEDEDLLEEGVKRLASVIRMLIKDSAEGQMQLRAEHDLEGKGKSAFW